MVGGLTTADSNAGLLPHTDFFFSLFLIFVSDKAHDYRHGQNKLFHFITML